ncbi:hypothetical protein ACQJ22_24965 [Pseudomonas fragariae (ex Marin et al. 2024)]|uniref:hypothetical protein n=1 Tax=Pseudomonas TaxID=286 RepID=UPI000449F0A2|nr:hypothetical protein [Pseudomonas syringae]AKF43789.1 hypothetical protein PsyrB_01190 [Pseudomonas syringae pv. syringae B301D]EXL29611.1 hypothetical protein PssB301D_04198 [Pseudomonas syringae pv. syringae str. B301D-R]
MQTTQSEKPQSNATPEKFEILCARVGAARVRFQPPKDAPKILVAIWHGSVSKNPGKKNTTPISNVVFRKLRSDNSLGGIHVVPSAISFLGTLRVGSVWSDGAQIGRLAMTMLSPTEVCFDTGAWKCVTAREAGVPERYRGFGLPSSQYNSWLIRLPTYTGKTILVPCLEFFTRCYGRSSETSRLIATYGLDAVEKNYFYGHERDSRTLKLQLRNHISHKEAVFLAHALYSDYTQRKCDDVHNLLKALFSPKDKIFLKAEPWFEGKAIIQGDGFWMDNDTFLLLNIDGISNPEGSAITIERQRYTADEGVAGTGRAYKKPPPEEASNQEIDLIDTEAPDNNHARVVLDSPLSTLGIKRKLIKTKQRIPGKRGTASPGDHRTLLAPGDAHRGGKGGGKSEAESPEWLVEGTLQQMWQTCTGLAKNHPQRISNVGWYTLPLGLQCEGIPQYQFLSVKSGSDKDSAKKPKQADTPPRKAVLIIRMTVDHHHIYVIEMYRKPSMSVCRKTGDSLLKEDSYCGLMVHLPTDSKEVERQLQLIFKNLLKHEGRIKDKDKEMSDHTHKVFIHKPREIGSTPLKKVVISNLNKIIGFTLKE